MLLEAIASAPDDDAPRLVAADWFAEHGQPERAELISLQCRRERLEPASPERERLDERLRDLKVHQDAWKPRFPNLRPVMVRGFPGAVAGEAGDIARAAGELAQLVPPLQGLTLLRVGNTRSVEALLRTSLWEQVRGLRLERLSELAALALFQSARVGHLRQLVIEGAEDLARQSWALVSDKGGLLGLRELGLFNVRAGAWAQTRPELSALDVLSLVNASLKPGDLKALARAPFWRRLQGLELVMNTLGPEGAEVFAATPQPSLRALDLSWSKLGADGLRALAQSALDLRILKLRQDNLDGSALLPLLEAVCTRQLQWLDVRGNAIDAPTLARLKERFGAGLLA
jgi:uncharacterized protein (TIGR02996 family)